MAMSTASADPMCPGRAVTWPVKLATPDPAPSKGVPITEGDLMGDLDKHRIDRARA
jgi:hypothetical protein